MTHTPENVSRALALAARGRSATEISREVGLPRRTVSDWLRGRVPRAARLPATGACSACGGGAHDLAGLPPSYAYLLGVYLGDGSIASHRRRVFKLRITLDAKYPAIIDETDRAMRHVLPASKVCRFLRTSGDVEVYSYSRAWPCLFPQHGPGKKHMREITLAPWQERHVAAAPELLLRGLIHSDGCRFQNTGRGGWRHPRYAFCNYSADIREIFCSACDLVGIRWTVSRYNVYVSRKADVARMDEFIGPKS